MSECFPREARELLARYASLWKELAKSDEEFIQGEASAYRQVVRDFNRLVRRLDTELPDDYVLVPKVPTMSMLGAGIEASVEDSTHYAMKKRWEAMLAAAS